jgi:hypothetical protein
MRELVLLVVLLSAAVWVIFFRGEGRLFGGGGGAEREASPLGDAALYAVHVDRLLGEGDGYDPGGRNLFQYYVPPRPKPKTQVRPPQPRPQTKRNPTPVKKTAPAEPRTSAPKPPRVTFKYLGFLGPKEDKIAVFEKGQGEDLELARIGDVIQGAFKLVGFGYESVELGYTDERFSDQTTELSMRR